MVGATFFRKGIFRLILTAMLASVLSGGFAVPALAHCPAGWMCDSGDCAMTEMIIKRDHMRGEQQLIGEPNTALDGNLGKAFLEHRKWWFDKAWKQILLPAMMKMAEQLSAVGYYQMFMIGTQFDAKVQLETQRELQMLQAVAHKDYQPSEEFCAIGSNMRSMAAADEKTRFNAAALNEIGMARQLASRHAASGTDQHDYRMRWDQYVSTYCNERDNGWVSGSGGGMGLVQNGLENICRLAANIDRNRLNIDIDYGRQMEERRTIDADFTDTQLPDTGQETDLLALMRNLYGHHTPTRDVIRPTAVRQGDGAGYIVEKSDSHNYLDLRSVMAKRNVAQNSFNAIAAMKMAGSPDQGSDPPASRATMEAILRQLGMPEDEIPRYLGDKPSYYAQLEILAKKIYQDQSFYAGLYDKPANIERRKVAMRAIELLLERAMYESRLRQEMLASVLLAAKLVPEEKAVEDQIGVIAGRDK